MAREQLTAWWGAAVDDLGEELPHPDAIEAVHMAFVDRVLAHAEATGALERVTLAGPRVIRDSEGREEVVGPGSAVLFIDLGGRAYRLAVAGG